MRREEKVEIQQRGAEVEGGKRRLETTRERR